MLPGFASASDNPAMDRASISTITLIVLAVLLFVPPLYVLSSGPATWLMCHDYLDLRVYVLAYHLPLRWLADRSPEFDRFIRWYEAAWEGPRVVTPHIITNADADGVRLRLELEE
jgi:hypothetical protein